MSFRHVIYIDNTNNKSDIVAHWLPTTATLTTIMDPNQPKPLVKLPISIEHDSMQYHTTMLINSATTLNSVSRDFLTRNNLLGKCIRGLKIDVRIANEQRISTTKKFTPSTVSLGHKNVNALSLTISPHLKCLDFIFGLHERLS